MAKSKFLDWNRLDMQGYLLNKKFHGEAYVLALYSRIDKLQKLLSNFF